MYKFNSSGPNWRHLFSTEVGKKEKNNEKILSHILYVESNNQGKKALKAKNSRAISQ
jgi:hypothetical protein